MELDKKRRQISSSLVKRRKNSSTSAEATEFQRNEKLIEILQRKGTDAHNAFVAALYETDQNHIIVHLSQSLHAIIEEERDVQESEIPNCLSTRQVSPLQTIIDEIQPIPSSVEDWKKGKLKGRGSFGDVYVCTNLSNGREIAGKYIKVFLPSENMLPREKLRFKNDIEPVLKEVSIMLKLKHERIVECFGCRIADHDLVIFMELMNNGSVRDEMRRIGAALDSTTTVKYIKQATEGLVFIHRQGIIHRDLKCDNLLLDGSKNVKLADFGTSLELRLKHGMTSSTFAENGSSGIKGSLLHMAPEVLQSKAYSRKSDVWSMGSTMVEMLTTMAPHEEATEGWDLSKFIFQAGTGNLKYNASELCPNADAAIQTLLNQIFQPAEQRPTSEHLLVELLRISRSRFASLMHLFGAGKAK